MVPVTVIAAMCAAALVATLLAFRSTKSFAVFLLVVGVLRFDIEVGRTIGGSSNLSSIWLLWQIGLCLLVLLRNRVLHHKPTAPEIFYGIFLLWCGIEASLSDNIAFAARTYLKLLYPLLAMLVFRLVIDGEQIVSTLMRRVILVAVMTCLLVGGITIRVAPPVLVLASPFFWFGAVFADSAALTTLVALSLWRLHGKAHYVVFAILLGTTSLFGGIRTGVGATAIAISAFAFCELGKKSLPLIGAIYLGSALAFVALPEMREKMFLDTERAHFTDVLNPATLDYENIDSSGRFTLWQTVLDRFFWDNPLMGSGLGATQAWFYGGGYRELMAEHSEYVHLLADTGAVGLGLYLAMIGSCVVAVWRVYRSTSHRLTRYLAVTALCMFPAFMFCMAFDNVLNYALPVGQYPFAFTGAVIGLCRAQRRDWERIDARQRKTPAGDPPPPETPPGGASLHPTYPLK